MAMICAKIFNAGHEGHEGHEGFDQRSFMRLHAASWFASIDLAIH
jgi:hypothetical protein